MAMPMGDGISNFAEMLALSNPWPIPPKPDLTEAERQARQQQARTEREKSEAERLAWKQRIAATLRPSLPPGQAPEENPELAARFQASRIALRQLIAELQRSDAAIENTLNAVAARHGIPRHAGTPEGRQTSLIGESEAGPMVVKSLDLFSLKWHTPLSGTNTTTIWLPRYGTLTGITGAGVTAGIWEAGAQPYVRADHTELTGRLVQLGGTAGSHATAVASTLAGAGTMDVFWRYYDDPFNPVSPLRTMPVGKQIVGPAKSATLKVHGLNSFQLNLAIAAAAGIPVSNHSYGLAAGWAPDTLSGVPIWEGYDGSSFAEDPRFGAYSANLPQGISCQQIDAFVHSSAGQYHLPVIGAGNTRDIGPGSAVPYYKRGLTGIVTDGSGQPLLHTAPRDWKNGDDGGYDTVVPMATAKNVLSVGAVGARTIHASIPGEDQGPASWSAAGPTDDGRIKPDVTAVGYHRFTETSTRTPGTLFAAHAGGPNAYYDETTPDPDGTAVLMGTSFAAPLVTGFITQAEEYRKILFPTGTPWLASTWKALVIASSYGYGTLLNYQEGHGMVYPERMFQTMEAHAIGGKNLIKEYILQQGQTLSFLVETTLPYDCHAVLAWTDPVRAPVPNDSATDPAQYLSTPLLVNDVDLRIGPFLPWTLLPDLSNKNAYVRAASAAGRDDSRNNVENVAVDDPFNIGARHMLTISHKGTLQGGSQAISLVLRGLRPVMQITGLTETGNPANPGEMALTFTAEPQAPFTLESTTNPVGPWTAMQSVVTASGGETSILFQRNPAEPRRFWRMRRGN